MAVKGSTITITSGTYNNFCKKYIATDVVLTGNIAFEGNTSIFADGGNISTRSANVTVANAQYFVLATHDYIDLGTIEASNSTVILWSDKDERGNNGSIHISDYLADDGTIYVRANTLMAYHAGVRTTGYETNPYKSVYYKSNNTNYLSMGSPQGGVILRSSDYLGRSVFRALNTVGTFNITTILGGLPTEVLKAQSFWPTAYQIVPWTETVYGTINLSSIQTEFGGSNPISLSEYYAGGSYVPSGTVGYPNGVSTVIPSSGQISVSNFIGATNKFYYTISSNTADVNLRTSALSAGWNGTAPLYVTINSNTFVYSTTTSAAAFTVSGSFPGGVYLTNNGTIVGKGGDGGSGASYGTGSNGQAGGPGMNVSSNITITNNGRIAGGGGGGGGGDGTNDGFDNFYGGGGGGGGIGNGTRGSGGGGASPGQSGTDGTLTAAGTGGLDGYAGTFYAGGNGGGYGSPGNSTHYSSGGAAGACLSGNTYITWTTLGTRNGTIT